MLSDLKQNLDSILCKKDSIFSLNTKHSVLKLTWE